MAETFERLGIQLELDNQIKGDPTQVLANLKKSLEDIAAVLKGIDLSKLGKAKVGDLSSDLKKTKDSAKDATAGLKEVAAAVAKAGEAAKKTAKDIQYVGRDFADFFKTNKDVFKSMADGSDELAKKMASPYYKELKAMRKEMQDTADVSAVVGKKIADNLVSMLNFSPDGKSAAKLRNVIEGAIKINSGVADLKQLERSNDIMVQIGNNAYHAKTQTEQLANTIANRLRRGTLEESDIKIFSKEKFDKDVKSVMTQLAGLRDFSDKNGLSVKGIGSLETKALNAKTLSDLDKVRDKIAEIKTSANRDLTFTKLEEQAEKLRRAYEGIRLPDDLLAKLNALNRSNFDNSYKGTAAFGRAIQDTRQSLNTQGIKLLPSYYSDKDADGAYKAYLKNLEDVKNQELRILTERGQQTLAILRNTATAEKAERDNAIKGWRDYIAALSAQGYKAVDGGSGYVKKTAVADVGQAQTLAINEQLSRTLDSLRAKSIDTKLTADQLATTFRQNGIEISKLDDKQILALQAGIRKLGFALADTKGNFREINKELTNASIISKLFGESIGKMTARLTEFYSIRTVIFAVSSEFRNAFTTLMDFNQALHDTAAIAGSSDASIKKMEESALSIAKSTKYSATEVVGAMKMLAQAGVGDVDLPEVTRVATMLATGTGATFDQATKVLTTGMNVWNIEGEKSIHVANVLTAALNASKLEIGELGTAFNYLANQNALFGKSIEETAALIGVLRNQGMEASTIGTSMRQFMKVLVAPTPKFQNLLNTYGISKEQIDPTKHSMTEILKVFEKVAEKGVSVKDIFKSLETRVGGGFATLFKAGSVELELMESRLKNSNAALIAYMESMKGFRAQVNVLRQEFVETMNVFIKGSSSTTFLSGLSKDVQDLLVGLRQVGKEWTSFKTAGISAIAAITALWNMTPWGRIITLGLGAATWAIKKQGEQALGPARGAEAQTKTFAEESAKFQRQSSDASDLMKIMKGKDLTEESYKKLSASNKKRVNEILNGEDSIFKGLNAQSLKYDEIKSKVQTLTSTQVQGTKTFISNINEQVRQIQLLDKQIAQKESMIESAKGGNMFTEGIEREVKELKAKRGPWAEAIKQMQSGVAGNVSFKDVGNGLRVATYDPYSAPTIDVNTDEKIPENTRGTETQYNSSKVILENLRLEREEILTRVKTIYQTADDLEAAFKRIEQIDKEYAEASGEKATKDVIANAKNIIKKEGQAKYNEYLANAQEIDDRKLAQLKAKQIKERQEIEKLQQQHELEIVRIEQDAQKKANEARIANLTKQITSAYTGDADRAKFVAEALRLTEANIDAEIDKQIAELTEKQRQAAESQDYNRVGRYQNQINNLNYDSRTEQKAEASKALNQQAVQGIQASEEKALQLEQQKLAVVEKQIAARKDSAWGADAVNALDIERLEAAKKAAQEERRIVLEKQAQIPAGELTNELADKYKTKLDGIAEKEKEITREIEKRNQGALGNFVDGMQEAWNRISDVNAAAKELGNSLTNTFVNGLSSTLSNTFSAALFPDQAKVNELQAKVNELRTQKADLEANIGTIEKNTDKTPEEIKNLNDYKTKLDEVNGALRQQEEAVRKQKDAWSTFADGLKGIMKEILKELQNYIVKLIAVWVMQKLVGLAFNAFGGDTALAGAEQGSFSETALLGMKNFSGAGMAKGGIVKGYAEGGLVNGISGGLIPESLGTPGKDSVPILAMPNEYVIPADVVRSWGADHFEKYRNGTFKKMAEGGLVGGGATVGSKSAESKDFSLQIINVADPSSIPPQPVDAQQVINIVSFDISKKGTLDKVIKGSVSK